MGIKPQPETERHVMPPIADMVEAAARRLQSHAYRTPVVTSRTLNAMVGADVYLKCENLQRVGAFKFRGAFNAISQLSKEERARGVIAYSSGNHAQAVAYVGQLLGVNVTIVMPQDAPVIKREATEGYGAEVVAYDPATESRETLASDLAADRGLTIVPPFDHPHVIAGQGTTALEFHEQVEDLDVVMTPCGGAGLLSGCAVATKRAAPRCRVVGVEPELADDATRSFRTKTLCVIDNPRTIADGTRTTSLGHYTFPLVLEYVDDFLTVSEEAICDAVRLLFFRLKLVVEPSGALGVAALLSHPGEFHGRIGVVLSGGNVDGPTMSRILTEA